MWFTTSDFGNILKDVLRFGYIERCMVPSICFKRYFKSHQKNNTFVIHILIYI